MNAILDARASATLSRGVGSGAPNVGDATNAASANTSVVARIFYFFEKGECETRVQRCPGLEGGRQCLVNGVDETCRVPPRVTSLA